jgi:hypothetical protein
MPDTLYTARFELPDLLEQGRSNLLRCRVYRNGVLATPTSGTVTVYDKSGNALVDDAAVTVTNSEATYNLLAATIASSTRGEGWGVEWALLMPDGVTHTFRNDAALVRARLYPVVADADLYRVASSLDPSGQPIHSRQSFDDKLEEAFLQIEQRLIAAGNRPNLVLSPSALREVHLYLTLALIFEDFATRLSADYEARAQSYRTQFDSAWSRLRFVYDTDDDGRPDDGARGGRKGPSGTLWLTSRR